MLGKTSLSICFLAISVLTSSNLLAQSPGYLGKHWFLQADLSSQLTLWGPNAANKGLTESFPNSAESTFGMSYRFGGKLAYTVSHNTSLFFSSDFYTTGLEYKYRSRASGTPEGDGLSDFHKTFNQLNVRNYSFGLMSFETNGSGSLSPMGLYLAPSIGITVYESSMLDVISQMHELSNGSISPMPINLKQSSVSVGIEIGGNTIFADRFLLNIGVSSRLALGFFTQEIPDVLYYGTTPFDRTAWNAASDAELVDEAQSGYKYSALRRISFHDALMAKIGLGVLLF